MLFHLNLTEEVNEDLRNDTAHIVNGSQLLNPIPTDEFRRHMSQSGALGLKLLKLCDSTLVRVYHARTSISVCAQSGMCVR